ncbi:MAG TPA: ornithine carbamoyltransferase [Anaerolineales bacterium]
MEHFLAIADHSPSELQSLLDLAVRLKAEWKSVGNRPVLATRVLGMIFQKPSLRTRVSFDMAMRHLGGDALYLSPDEIGLGKRESIADVARVMAVYVDAVMARVFEHDHILELARWSDVPIINGLSDYNHPCQALADALTIQERLGNLKDINVSYVGDGNNVAASLMHICAKLGANFTIATPEDYELNEHSVKLGEMFSAESGSAITLLHNPHEAVQNADVIYTDTWTSMGQEEEAQQRMRVFPPFQVNSKLVNEAKPNVIVMHCLPAHRGQEITDEVADGPHSVIFAQAHNRLHAQKAILVRLLAEVNELRTA